MASYQVTNFSCEVCGEKGFTEEDLHTHVLAMHVEDAVSCPFCDLGDISPDEMVLHVSSAHLDNMTPQEDCDVAFIDDDIHPKTSGVSGMNHIGNQNKRPSTSWNNISNGPYKKPEKPSVKVEKDGSFSSNLNDNINDFGGSSDSGIGSASCGSPLRTQLSLNLKKANSSSSSHYNRTSSPQASGSRSQHDDMKQCPLCPFTHESTFQLQEHINRQHFDLNSPSFPMISPAADQSHFNCPLCVHRFETSAELELHVNLDHRDILSPAKVEHKNCVTTPGDENSNESCPVCSLCGFKNTKEMAEHIEEHFNQKVSPITPDVSCDRLLAREIEQREREVRRLQEQKEFEMLQAQYGMDEQGNFCEQSLTNMQRAVCSGEMTVADYYERQIGLKVAEKWGIDDGSSCTKGILSRIHSVSSSSNNVVAIYMCTTVDHYASTYGDKGWGCGYRNIQMLMSSLMHNTSYYDRLASIVETSTTTTTTTQQRNTLTVKNASTSSSTTNNINRASVPSISRLQQLIEKAWSMGFDTAGSDQLGGRLYNTRKWIGATEVVTLLSSFRIKCQLIDFHKPTASDGTHPQLFNWVKHYFQKNEDFKPPLYLQHQGHSRTIIGVEVTQDDGVNLLVLDPSHSLVQMGQLKNTINGPSTMRLIRKSLSVMQARQYQIVAVQGLIETEQEYQLSKVLKSMRVP